MSPLRPDAAPDRLVPLVRACARTDPDDVPFRRRPDPAGRAREAAVLILFGTSEHGPDLLLTERAPDMRSHAGQAAFPGGSVDPDDDGPVGAALREAREETGLDPAGVVPLATLPALTIPVTGFTVTPVVGHWAAASPVRVVDTAETAAVVRVPVADLADPTGRFTVTGPSGHVGPAFAVGGLLIWGFTAGVLSWVLDLAGWTRDWDTDDVRVLDEVWAQRRELSTPYRPPYGPHGIGDPTGTRPQTFEGKAI